MTLHAITQHTSITSISFLRHRHLIAPTRAFPYMSNYNHQALLPHSHNHRPITMGARHCLRSSTTRVPSSIKLVEPITMDVDGLTHHHGRAVSLPHLITATLASRGSKTYQNLVILNNKPSAIHGRPITMGARAHGHTTVPITMGAGSSRRHAQGCLQREHLLRVVRKCLHIGLH